jgi:hypothetical protein
MEGKMALADEIRDAARKVSTDSITMSIGEVASYYSEEHLEINPEFQRAFRWKLDKKSNFIESVLLSIPIPSIFVFENEDGSWELVDGLQRLSTLLEFMGILRDHESQELYAPTSLIPTKYLKSLKGAVWEKSERVIDVPIGQQIEIGVANQRKIRTARIQVEILRHPSDVETKYDLFQRLNRGGETANAQEVRNCLCVMANTKEYLKIRQFANEQDFLSVVRLTPAAIEQQRNLEYLMRFIAHTRFEYDPKLDVENFIDDCIRNVLVSENPNSWEELARKTFRLLDESCGDVALLPRLGGGGKGNRVTLRQIEAIAVGVGRNLEAILALQNPKEFVQERITSFWEQDEVDQMSAAGLSGTQRLQRTVPFGRMWFNPVT